jgi:hypothetical protein
VDHEELLGEIEEGEEQRLERELFGESEEESEGQRERARLAKEQEEKREREEEERARRILDEARRERAEQARKRQEQIATPAKRAKLAVKAEEAGLHPPRRVEKEVPLQKGTVSEDKKASLLVIAESRRKLEAWQKAKQARQLEEERVHRARMESIAAKAEKEAAKRKLDAEQSRQLAEERKAQLSPKGKGRKAVVSPPKQPNESTFLHGTLQSSCGTWKGRWMLWWQQCRLLPASDGKRETHSHPMPTKSVGYCGTCWVP